MTTPELLENATARPWVAERMLTTPKCKDFGYVINSLTAFKGEEPVTLPDRVADCYGYFVARANAELIVRAVSSFAAMWDALRLAQPFIESAKGNAERGSFAALEAMQKALALADGGEQ